MADEIVILSADQVNHQPTQSPTHPMAMSSNLKQRTVAEDELQDELDELNQL